MSQGQQLTLEQSNDRDARALLAVATGADTVRAVADRIGCSVSTAHAVLCRLCDRGMVTWTPGRKDTLRPLVEIVAATPW